ncbi:hypothetical protein Scep_014776 [Stephania cephalantha]|uniref:Uncharacterized protein n=1 Tax=Stephania cephalantha TaxID=152367 RepID=A0AAP0J2N0_9MAGN
MIAERRQRRSPKQKDRPSPHNADSSEQIEHPSSARFSQTPTKASGSRFSVLNDLTESRNLIIDTEDRMPTNSNNPWIFGSTPPPHLKNGSSAIPHGESTHRAGKAKKGKKDGERSEYATTDTQSCEESTSSQKVNKSKKSNNKMKAPLVNTAKGPLQLQGPIAHTITYKPGDFPKLVGVGKGTVQVWCPVPYANYDFANRLNEGSKKRARRSDHKLAQVPCPNDKSRPPSMQAEGAETMAMEDCLDMEADREEGQEFRESGCEFWGVGRPVNLGTLACDAAITTTTSTAAPSTAEATEITTDDMRHWTDILTGQPGAVWPLVPPSARRESHSWLGAQPRAPASCAPASHGWRARGGWGGHDTTPFPFSYA